jgi:putative phosphoserine phosphatase / 1-acylglycerol-3-phosphate O-acyltransferase
VNEPRTVGAFFDIDGTLVPSGSLEWRFVLYLLSRDKIGARNIGRWLLNVIRLAPQGWRHAIETNKFYLAGLPVSLAAEWADSMACEHSNREGGFISPGGLERIVWHQSLKHRVFLVSGTLAPLATAVANFLPGKVEVVATDLAACARPSNKHRARAIWSGELAGEHLVGAAKVRAVQVLAAKHQLNLNDSHAYGDSVADCGMLECVGHPEVVNPSRRMALLARKRGWPIERWEPANDPHAGNFSKFGTGKQHSVTAVREQTR